MIFRISLQWAGLVTFFTILYISYALAAAKYVPKWKKQVCKIVNLKIWLRLRILLPEILQFFIKLTFTCTHIAAKKKKILPEL